MGYITFVVMAAALVSCSKPTDDIKPPPSGGGEGGGGGTKNAASFTSNPVLNPDTLYWKTPGVMTWGASYTKGATLYVGTTAVSTAADFQSANVPALEQSATGRVDLIGEDDKVVSRNVNYPMYDSNFTYICKGSKKWQQDGKDTLFWAGGYIAGSIDSNKYIHYKTIVNGKRTGIAIAPNGSTSNGYWNSLNNGAQFWNGLQVYDNVFLSETYWIRERHFVSGGISYIHRIRHVVVP